jgi:hypothetical protein
MISKFLIKIVQIKAQHKKVSPDKKISSKIPVPKKDTK